MTLRTKLTIVTCAVTAVMMGATAFAALSFFRDKMTETVRRFQIDETAHVAAELDRKIERGLQLVAKNADLAEARHAETPSAAALFLDQADVRPLDPTHFAVVVRGKVAASRGPALPADSLAEMTSRAALGDNLHASVISSCRNPRQRLLLFFAPFGRSGSSVLVLGIDLEESNFVSRLVANHAAEGKEVAVYSGDGTVIACSGSHSGDERASESLLQLLTASPDASAGSGTAFDENGREVVAAYTRVSPGGLTVVTSKPSSNIFEPVKTAALYLSIAVLIGMMSMVAIVSFYMRHLLSPLRSFSNHMERLAHKTGADRFFPARSQDEIGMISGKFNSMIEAVDRSEEKLRHSEERYRIVADYATDCAFWRDPSGRFLYVAPCCAGMTGYTAEEFCNDPHLMEKIVCEEDLPLWRRVTTQSEGGEEAVSEVRFMNGTGETRLGRIACRPIYGTEGDFLGIRGSLTDITEMQQLASQIDFLSTHDTLTKLPNRKAFEQNVARVLSEPQGRSTGVILLGLDRFKWINESLGHQHGDDILRQVAQRLTRLYRCEGTVARIGGDLFAVAIYPLERATGLGEHVRLLMNAFDAPLQVAGIEVTVTACIGVVRYPDNGGNVNTLLRNAESALFDAKTRGTRNFSFYEQAMNAEVTERIMVENLMRAGIEAGEFFLLYQPQVEAATGKIAGAEVLVRWGNRSVAEIPPSVFIPLAEETGLIVALGNRILRDACTQMREWCANGRGVPRIAVNISPVQFKQDDFVMTVRNIISETGVDPQRLELEITESMLVSHEEENLAKLRALSDMKVSLALDDFGTGYSSLSHLRHFPIDRLKIDRSFVLDMESEKSRAIITSIIGMGKALGMKVIAEGVETATQSAFLGLHGVDELQGYYLHLPVTAGELEELHYSAERSNPAQSSLNAAAETLSSTGLPLS